LTKATWETADRIECWKGRQQCSTLQESRAKDCAPCLAHARC
jgi:hypothetical protein